MLLNVAFCGTISVKTSWYFLNIQSFTYLNIFISDEVDKHL